MGQRAGLRQRRRDVGGVALVAQGGADPLGGVVQLRRGDVGAGVAERQARLAPGGQDVQVQVVDLEPGDEQRGARRGPGLLLRLPDRLRDEHQVRQHVVGRLGELHDLVAGDHEHVAVGDRGDGAERDGDVVGPHEPAGDVPGDDLGEQGAHDATLVRRARGRAAAARAPCSSCGRSRTGRSPSPARGG